MGAGGGLLDNIIVIVRKVKKSNFLIKGTGSFSSKDFLANRLRFNDGGGSSGE